MQLYFRAGLVALTVALLFVLTAAAPIPSQQTSRTLYRRSPPYLPVQSSSANFIDEISHVPQTLVARSGQVTPTIPESDIVILVRRKSIFTKIKQGFQKMAHGIKHVAQKIGQGIKTAAKKVGTFFKKTGAVIAKFALKVVATVQKVASKIVKYIPVIGKPLSKALGASSSAWNAASNAIHAKLPKKLEKGTKVMDTVRTVAGFVPRDALSFEEPDMRELVERDVYGVYLDSREYDYYDDE